MASPPSFNPANWYWIVGGSTTQVYSSAVGDFVPVADAAYQTWLAKGNQPTKIDTETNLGGALAPYLQRPADTATNVLDGYKEGVAAKLTPVDVQAKLFFNLENRVRVLEGRPELTFIQYRAIIKSLM